MLRQIILLFSFYDSVCVSFKEIDTTGTQKITTIVRFLDSFLMILTVMKIARILFGYYFDAVLILTPKLATQFQTGPAETLFQSASNHSSG